jgi:hypothetical protein
MIRSMTTASIAIFTAVWSSAAISEDSWVCEQADLTREVLIVYPAAPEVLPCQVFYSKPDENLVPRMLWEARNTEGYCEEKATEFVRTLESWGWQCRPEMQR